MSPSEGLSAAASGADVLRAVYTLRGFERWRGDPLDGDLARLLASADRQTLLTVVATALARLDATQGGLYPKRDDHSSIASSPPAG